VSLNQKFKIIHHIIKFLILDTILICRQIKDVQLSGALILKKGLTQWGKGGMKHKSCSG
jgi:hypothetical protein